MNNNNDETVFSYKVRQILNHGTDSMDSAMTSRLRSIRQEALDHQRIVTTRLRLAGLAHLLDGVASLRGRSIIAALALTAGLVGTYYWNELEQASEYEEIDSALLTDELPPSAYLDRGFHAWLERSSQSFSQ